MAAVLRRSQGRLAAAEKTTYKKSRIKHSVLYRPSAAVCKVLVLKNTIEKEKQRRHRIFDKEAIMGHRWGSTGEGGRKSFINHLRDDFCSYSTLNLRLLQ